MGWDRLCNRETLNFLEKNIERFLKTIQTWAGRLTYAGGWNPGRKAESEKLLCPEGFSEQGTQAVCLHGSEGLWDQPTGHRPTQSWVVKEELCHIQLGPQNLDLTQKHSSRPLTLDGLLFKAT